MGLFDTLDAACGDAAGDSKEIIRAPFGWPGGKSKSIDKVIPHLPYNNLYVEPFGGSFAIGLARRTSKVEVFNDRYGGVVSFYRVLRSPELFEKLLERIEMTTHSREEFYWCKDTWEHVDDDVERAARWYYMIAYSFSTLGRNWGRALSPGGRMAGKIRDKLKWFPDVHARMKYVQIENQDWFDCISDYDKEDTVFYLDPPYPEVHSGTYKHEMSNSDYMKLMDTIFNCQGFVALSGYAGTKIFEDQPWDERHTWEAYVSAEAAVFKKGNRKENLKGLTERGKAQEVLWIKYAQ